MSENTTKRGKSTLYYLWICDNQTFVAVKFCWHRVIVAHQWLCSQHQLDQWPQQKPQYLKSLHYLLPRSWWKKLASSLFFTIRLAVFLIIIDLFSSDFFSVFKPIANLQCKWAIKNWQYYFNHPIHIIVLFFERNRHFNFQTTYKWTFATQPVG